MRNAMSLSVLILFMISSAAFAESDRIVCALTSDSASDEVGTTLNEHRFGRINVRRSLGSLNVRVYVTHSKNGFKYAELSEVAGGHRSEFVAYEGLNKKFELSLGIPSPLDTLTLLCEVKSDNQ